MGASDLRQKLRDGSHASYMCVVLGDLFMLSHITQADDIRSGQALALRQDDQQFDPTDNTYLVRCEAHATM